MGVIQMGKRYAGQILARSVEERGDGVEAQDGRVMIGWASVALWRHAAGQPSRPRRFIPSFLPQQASLPPFRPTSSPNHNARLGRGTAAQTCVADRLWASPTAVCPVRTDGGGRLTARGWASTRQHLRDKARQARTSEDRREDRAPA